MKEILMGIGTAGLKPSGNPDVLLLYLPTEFPTHFIFTKNRVKSGSVEYSRKALEESGGYVRAIFINSGNANCMAGDTVGTAEEIASYISKKFDIRREYVLIFSTGIIGEPLPVERVKKAVDDACKILEPLDLKRASEVISTTDSFPKYDFVKYDRLEVFGFAKGAGMIHPNMATMLAFIFTNADMDPNYIKELTKRVGEKTFNSITVDGCTSTNDSFGIISSGDIRTDSKRLEDAVTEVAERLAKKIVEDGEGATKVIKVLVKGAKDDLMAKDMAERVAISQLVKTAVHGCDPNWGRVISALGTSPYEFDPKRVEIRIGDIILYKGEPVDNRKDAREYMMANREILIEINLNMGNAMWVYYSSDLTCNYVRLNSEYTT